jgi:hypothetical protein
MREVTANGELVACCGLYCGACGAYLKGRCPGCHENVKAGWCKIRSCCVEHAYATCADCNEHAGPGDCKHFNTPVARLLGFVLNSNRPAGVLKIRELGREGYAAFMADRKIMKLPRRGT